MTDSNTTSAPKTNNDFSQLSLDIKQWGLALGFDHIGITDTELKTAEAEHQAWISKGFHGEMNYMVKHGIKRTQPAELVPNTLRVISARLDYLPPQAIDSESVLNNSSQAFISRYALGRDYHKVMRNKLQQLCTQLQSAVSPDLQFNYRASRADGKS